MNQKVYINGVGQTQFGEIYDKSLLDLAHEAISVALKDAKKDITQIEAIYVANMLSSKSSGVQHLSSQLSGLLGVHIPIISLESACASGGMAVNNAWKDVKSGHFGTVLVLGAEKMTEHSPKDVNSWLMHATNAEEQATGISFAGLYGIMANAYLQEHQLPPNILDFGPALAHKNALNSPFSQFKREFSPENIRNSRPIATPLNMLNCAPLTDGAAALVLSNTSKNSEKSHIYLQNSSVATDSPNLSQRETLTSIKSTKKALETLKLDTIISNIDILCLHDCFSISLILTLEDLGLAKAGTGWQMLKKAYEAPNNAMLPLINPDGGLKAHGHPVGATGVRQIATCVRHLRQNPQKTTALAHNLGGTGGTCVLHVLKKIKNA